MFPAAAFLLFGINANDGAFQDAQAAELILVRPVVAAGTPRVRTDPPLPLIDVVQRAEGIVPITEKCQRDGVAVFVNVGKGFDRPVEGIVLGGDEFALDDDGDGFIENHIPLGRALGVAAKFIAAGDKQPAAVVVLSIIVNDPHIRVTLLMQDPHSAMRFQGRLPGRRTTDLHHRARPAYVPAQLCRNRP